MTPRSSYKTTLFDRLGPDAGPMVRALTYAAVGTFIAFVLFFVIGLEILHLRVGYALPFAIAAGVTIGALMALVPLAAASGAEKAFVGLMVSGHTTPYTEQYSYQQTLVMQGRLDEALSSLEAIIAEPDSTVDVRIRAAELYAREAKQPERAAALFREAIRHPKCSTGEEVYSTNRLVDLLHGPLGQPGRALVELRRLADRYPDSAIAERATTALRTLKALAVERDQAVSS